VPSAKTASARVTLALAVAALALAGCGGGGEEDQAASAASSQAAAQEQEQEDQGQAKAQAAAEQAGSGAGAKAKAPGGDGAASAPSGPGQKHGPRIAAPKGPAEQPPTPAQLQSATVADMTLQSPAIQPAGEGLARLPATYTCDGEDSWPALRWSGVPAGSEELILYAMGVQPVEGKLFVAWSVAGLDPGLSEIEAGKLPEGAVVGENSYGKVDYEICPPPGSGEIYMFAIYALPRALAPKRGFDARELRQRILDVSGNVGLLPAVYARG
jgi:phosphatidylethanolamine-binding protein (PEBP) family uncharacterized protein